MSYICKKGPSRISYFQSKKDIPLFRILNYRGSNSWVSRKKTIVGKGVHRPLNFSGKKNLSFFVDISGPGPHKFWPSPRIPFVFLFLPVSSSISVFHPPNLNLNCFSLLLFLLKIPVQLSKRSSRMKSRLKFESNRLFNREIFQEIPDFRNNFSLNFFLNFCVIGKF